MIGGERYPIGDTWWQTETGTIMITTLPGIQDTRPGSAGKPLPGNEAAVLDQEGNDAGTERGLLGRGRSARSCQRDSARCAACRRTTPEMPFSSTGPISVKVTSTPAEASTVSWLTRTSPGRAYSAIREARFTVRP